MPTDWYNSWVSRDVHGRDPASRLAMSCTMAKDFLGIAVSVVLALASSLLGILLKGHCNS